jgi:hypothetical protein
LPRWRYPDGTTSTDGCYDANRGNWFECWDCSACKRCATTGTERSVITIIVAARRAFLDHFLIILL